MAPESSTFEVPRFGDDGLFPDARGWWSIPLTVSLWSAIFTIVYFSTRNLALEDSVTATGYIAILFVVFIVVIGGVIPAATITFGRVVDDSTKHLPRWRAGLIFGAIGLVLGLVPAVFVYQVNHAYGWLPFTQFMIPSPLAAFVATLVLSAVFRRPAYRTFVVVMTTIIVIGCLGIGVAVLTGAL